MPTDQPARDSWYAQPVLWLGGLLLGASLAGCAWMIALGARHADEPLPGIGNQVLKTPIERTTAAQEVDPR